MEVLFLTYNEDGVLELPRVRWFHGRTRVQPKQEDKTEEKKETVVYSLKFSTFLFVNPLKFPFC